MITISQSDIVERIAYDEDYVVSDFIMELAGMQSKEFLQNLIARLTKMEGSFK